MRLPWVSRAVYEDLLHMHRESDASAHASIHTAWSLVASGQSAYNDLVMKYIARASPDTPAPIQVPEREPSIVTLAIREQADGDKGLATYLRAYATKCKREGMSDAQIVDALAKWETTEPDPLSAP